MNGRMTSHLLHRIVGHPGGTVPSIAQLTDIPVWWGLFYDNPLVVTDPTTVEILGGTYERPEHTVPGDWDAFGLTGLVNSIDVEFLNIPPGNSIHAVGLWDDDTGGKLLGADVLDDPVNFPDGGSWVLPAGDFYFGFDIVGLG